VYVFSSKFHILMLMKYFVNAKLLPTNIACLTQLAAKHQGARSPPKSAVVCLGARRKLMTSIAGAPWTMLYAAPA
jgi:hypothetical protein